MSLITLRARMGFAIVLSALLGVGTAHADTVNVDARDSIFSSSSGLPGSSDSTSLGSVVIALPAGATSITFSATGTISPNASASGVSHGADGGNYDSTGVNIDSYGSISGVIDTDDRTLALMGAFTTAAVATGSAAARLDFTGNHDFTSLSPLVNQSFFIGDGKTSSSVTQTFFVPAGATYLQLGFADAFAGSNIAAFVGLPSSYGDNSGSLSVTDTVTVAAVPLPPTGWMGLALLGGLGAFKLRRRIAWAI
jgi:hypothetical protein